MRVHLASFFLVLVPIASVAATDSYICVAESATGFKFEKQLKQWSPTAFKTSDKFIVRRPKAEELKLVKNASWVVMKVGSDMPNSVCTKDFNEYGFLFCEGFEKFDMNRKSLRFLSAYLIGYVGDSIPGESSGDKRMAEGSNTPSLQIGTCAAL